MILIVLRYFRSFGLENGQYRWTASFAVFVAAEVGTVNTNMNAYFSIYSLLSPILIPLTRYARSSSVESNRVHPIVRPLIEVTISMVKGLLSKPLAMYIKQLVWSMCKTR